MNVKTLLSTAFISSMAIASAAFAVDNGGGFTGPGTETAIVSVEQAKGMSDDTVVILQGNIQKKVGDELYLFSDGKDTVIIEIDDDEWNGITVGPDELVQITGEIDKGWTSMEIDVEQIQKVKK